MPADDGGYPSSPGTMRRDGDAAEVPPRSVFLAVCAYLPVLCLIPVLTRTADDFVKFHARQGLALFIAEFFAAGLWFMPRVGPYVAGALLLLVGIFMIVAVAEVLQQRLWELPLFRGLSSWIDL